MRAVGKYGKGRQVSAPRRGRERYVSELPKSPPAEELADTTLGYGLDLHEMAREQGRPLGRLTTLVFGVSFYPAPVSTDETELQSKRQAIRLTTVASWQTWPPHQRIAPIANACLEHK